MILIFMIICKQSSESRTTLTSLHNITQHIHCVYKFRLELVYFGCEANSDGEGKRERKR